MRGQQPAKWRDALYYAYYEYPGVHSVKKHEGAFDGRYKLIHYYEQKEWEFFDLKSDPNEMRNIYSNSESMEEILRMKGVLAKLKSDFNQGNEQAY